MLQVSTINFKGRKIYDYSKSDDRDIYIYIYIYIQGLLYKSYKLIMYQILKGKMHLHHSEL
jgi:hypothetical protein